MAGTPHGVKALPPQSLPLVPFYRYQRGMNDGKAPSASDDRAARLAQQLRANLRKRKGQARALAGVSDDKAPQGKG